jgi:hypothetical protein
MLHPFDKLRLAIAQADHASEVRGTRMTTVVVSNLEVDKLLSSRMKVGAWFIQFLIAQRCGISICLWMRLFA